MAYFKEIVTKAVVGKGKKATTQKYTIVPDQSPNTVLGCWIINHKFNGSMANRDIYVNGAYDVNVWYSYDNDTKTEVYKDTNTYQETVKVRKRDDLDSEGEEIIIRSLKQPTCSKVDINDNKVIYTIEKELGIELVGDTKVKIAVDENEEPWEEIMEDQEKVEEAIENEVKEDFINEETI